MMPIDKNKTAIEIPDVSFRSSDATEDIELIELNDLYERKSHMGHDPEKPHRMGFNLLVHIRQGKGAEFIDFQHYPFEDDNYIFVRKKQVHAFDLHGRPQGTAILFTDQFIDRLQTSMRVPLFTPMLPIYSGDPVVRPDHDLSQSCATLISEIQKENRKEDRNLFIVMFLFSSLFLMVARASSSVENAELSETNKQRFSQFLAFLERDFTRSRDASDYAEQLNITYKTLNQLCKLATGNTAKYLIDAFVILEAKRRLVLEKQAIQQLSFDLGFEDSSNFVKYFKRHTGQTPHHFQKNSKG